RGQHLLEVVREVEPGRADGERVDRREAAEEQRGKAIPAPRERDERYRREHPRRSLRRQQRRNKELQRTPALGAREVRRICEVVEQDRIERRRQRTARPEPEKDRPPA